MDSNQSDIQSSDKEEPRSSSRAVVMESDITDEGAIEFDSDEEADVPISPSEEDSTSMFPPDGTSECKPVTIHKHSQQDKLKAVALRRHLDALSEAVLEREFNFQRTRDELRECRSRLQELISERDQVLEAIKEAEASNQNGPLYRLRSMHGRLCREVTAEEQLEINMAETLQGTEMDLAKAQVEQARYFLLEDELKTVEDRVEAEKQEAGAIRIRKEQAQAILAEKRRRARDKDHMAAVRERERKQRQAMASARRNREQANKFLKETMARVRQREADEEERLRDQLDRKVNSLLSLKGNIEANKDILAVHKARNLAVEAAAGVIDGESKAAIDASGSNSEEVLMRKSRMKQLLREDELFESEQRNRETEIVARLLREEKHKKRLGPIVDPASGAVTGGKRGDPGAASGGKRGVRQRVFVGRSKPRHKHRVATSGSSSVDGDVDERMREPIGRSRVLPVVSSDDAEFSPFGLREEPSLSSGDHIEEEDEDLALPEFPGLWLSGGEGVVKPEVKQGEFTLNYQSKMERDIMAGALERQRGAIVKKQVVCGREFVGVAFQSKPEIIHFNDLNVGSEYKKKVIITNISYSIISLKLVGISEHLKDFIRVEFDSPGQLSAGMSCELLVSFSPMINEDLDGFVIFLGQTGEYRIPIRCSTKKVDVSLDSNRVDFGAQVVIGETLRRSVMLRNSGALGSRFTFRRQVPAEKVESSITESTIVVVEEKVSEKDGIDDITDIRDDVIEVIEDSIIDNVKDSSTVVPSIMEVDSSSFLDGVSNVTAGGDIRAFSQTKLELVYKPTIPGRVDVEFVVEFEDGSTPSISVRVAANAIDIPIRLDRQVIDMRICADDRLYQESLTVESRSPSALRIKFEVPKELREHIEILPKTGFIQSRSTFTGQLKFRPNASLTATSYWSDGVLEAPITIRVANQTAPVTFTLLAVTTEMGIDFDQSDLDFGYCTVHESAVHEITMTNRSLLPQEFGFLGLPNFVEVQPNHGFGTILPRESIKLDVIFKPGKAKDYKFQINCKTLINRDFSIECRGIGCKTPLELSDSELRFPATVPYDAAVMAFSVANTHCSTNEYTHAVPRAGSKGPVPAVGPTPYQLVSPTPWLLCDPMVGVVAPGDKVRVRVRFAPTLSDSDIREKALEFLKEEVEMKRLRAVEEEDKPVKSKKSKSKENLKSAAKPSVDEPVKLPSVEDIQTGSVEYNRARSTLLRDYQSQLSSFTIPCYVGEARSSGDAGSGVPYNIANTLYLRVHCPVVAPSLVLLSNHGNPVVDFNQVALGSKATKSVTLQNISNRVLELGSSILDLYGPFLLVNALRPLQPDSTATLILSFTPTLADSFNETLTFSAGGASLHIQLVGLGVSPSVDVDTGGPEPGCIDFGHILAKETTSRVISVGNRSDIDVNFRVSLASRTRGVQTDSAVVGNQNWGGAVVFDVSPVSGCIPPGTTRELTATFAPDHPSRWMADRASISLFGLPYRDIDLIGVATPSLVYVTGYDDFRPRQESLSSPPFVISGDPVDQTEKIILVFQSLVSDSGYNPATRRLTIGCSKSPSLQGKKGGEFSFDAITAIQQFGFSIDIVKGSMDVGGSKVVSLTWKPVIGCNPDVPVETGIGLTLKSDSVLKYNVLLRGIIVSEEHVLSTD